MISPLHVPQWILVHCLYIQIQGGVPDKLCIYRADKNYMDVFSTLAKSVAKEEKKENPAPKHPIQTMNRTPGCPALMNWDSGLL